ncbi:MAG: hypothetical protein HY569_02645 [Candidatus Magasanikbacteria bacterium]|nr:hypothetical protein [Candidatus Magasanikbacteria bacterium]
MSFRKFLFSLLICLFVLAPTIALAAYGLEETAGAAGLKKTGPTELPVLIGSVLGTGLSLVGVLFFALMLYGGLTWMLARGNSEQETKALDTITAAIIGIVIVLASYAITNFVFKSIGTGSSTGGSGNIEVAGCIVNEATLTANCSILAVCPSGTLGATGGSGSTQPCVLVGSKCTNNTADVKENCDSANGEKECKAKEDVFCEWK